MDLNCWLISWLRCIRLVGLANKETHCHIGLGLHGQFLSTHATHGHCHWSGNFHFYALVISTSYLIKDLH